MRLIDQKYSIRKYLYDKYELPVYINRAWEIDKSLRRTQSFFYLENISFRSRRISPTGVRSRALWAIRYYPKLGDVVSSEEESLRIASEIELELQYKKYIPGYLVNYPTPLPISRSTNEKVPDSINLPNILYIFVIGIKNSSERAYRSRVFAVNVPDGETITMQLPFRSYIASKFIEYEIYAGMDGITFYLQDTIKVLKETYTTGESPKVGSDIAFVEDASDFRVGDIVHIGESRPKKITRIEIEGSIKILPVGQTRVIGGGNSNTFEVVTSSYYKVGDLLWVGDNTRLLVTDINYDTNEITVTNNFPFADNDLVSSTEYHDVIYFEAPIVIFKNRDLVTNSKFPSRVAITGYVENDDVLFIEPDEVLIKDKTLFIVDILNEQPTELFSANVSNLPIEIDSNMQVNLDSFYLLNTLQTECSATFEEIETWTMRRISIGIGLEFSEDGLEETYAEH